MSEPTLSIVMPVFNVAPYLPHCLESLAALNPPADEIIVVDDGSTDDCPRILAEFAPRLPQMRVIRQENGGLSAARNTGLEAARGKYLVFIDSDDFVEPDAYTEGLRRADEEQLDIVLFNARFHYEGRQPDATVYPGATSTEIISGKEWLRRRLQAGRFLHMVWMHLYRRDFIEAHHFRFTPRLIHEDVIWTTEVLLAAKRVRYLDQIAINYRIPIRRPTPEQRQRQLEAIVASSVTNARTLSRFVQGLDDDPELRRMLGAQLVDGALSVFHKLERMPDRAVARTRLMKLKSEGFLLLLWRHAVGFAQHRRIARHWLRSWLAGAGK